MEDTLKAQIEELRFKEEELKKERWHLEALFEKKKREGYQKLNSFFMKIKVSNLP